MEDKKIKNFNELATTANRDIVLQIMESGLEAINTEKVIFNSIKLEGDVLKVSGKDFDLSKFKNIKVVGFGKASIEGAVALEKILGSRISQGVVIGLRKAETHHIESFAGTHPRPSVANLEAGAKIFEIVNDSTEQDLIIALVSGGGSALLAYTQKECEQGSRLYDSFLKTGKTISEINTVRKHLSVLKGGGLAELAYPATVIGLIFSDVPGDNFHDVASGPTYKDKTSMQDAERIIKDNDLGDFDLIETPKEDKFFEKVHNFALVSNRVALQAMSDKASEFDLKANILSTDLYDEPAVLIKKIFEVQEKNSVVLAAGEPSMSVPKFGGKGGRNLHLGLMALQDTSMDKDSVFLSFASDGLDNTDAAGAMADHETLKKAERAGLHPGEYLEKFDSYNFFEKTGDLIHTGPTESNVSDLMILLNKENGSR
jgi:glycerate-2-kinase